MNYDTQPIADIMDKAIKNLKKLMKPKTQKQQIRIYLEAGGKLTPMAALNFWGCFRLSARIFDIREDYGFEWCRYGNREPLKEIKTEMVKTASGKRIAEYSLNTQPNR